MDLPVDVVKHEVVYVYKLYSLSCQHLFAESAATESELVTLLAYIDGAAAWTETIDWSVQQALLITMPGCNQAPDYTIERVRHCSDGRVVIDAERPAQAVDVSAQQYWVLAVPTGTYAGSSSRVTVCDTYRGCTHYEDGVEVE